MSRIVNSKLSPSALGGGTSPWVGIVESVSGSTTEVVDNLANSQFQALKYHVVVYNEANARYRIFNQANIPSERLMK